MAPTFQSTAAGHAEVLALQLGPASRVAPIDELSLPPTVRFASVLLHEPMTWRLGGGVGLRVAGALLALS